MRRTRFPWLRRLAPVSLKAARSPRKTSRVRLAIELLESRDLPTTVHYVSSPATAFRDTWIDPNIWSTGSVPVPGDDVVLDLNNPKGFILHADTAVTVNSLVLSASGEVDFYGSFSADSVNVSSRGISFQNSATISDLTVSAGGLDGSSVEFSGPGGSAGTTDVDTLTWSGGDLANHPLSGRAAVQVGDTLTISGSDPKGLGIALQNAGTGTWSGADIAGDGGIENLADASLDLGSSGNLTGGYFSNAGTLTVNAGAARAFTVGGDFTQTADGVLNLELKQVTGTQYDTITANALHLHGTLHVSLLGGSSIAVGDTFTILAGTRTETATDKNVFDEVELPDVGKNVALKVVYAADGVKIVAKKPMPLATPPVSASATCPTGPAPQAAAQASAKLPSPVSVAPVRYADGTNLFFTTDLSAEGFGGPWGQSRYWTNGPGYVDRNRNGDGWVDSNLPYLLQGNGDDSQILVIASGVDAYYFDLVGAAYQGRFFLRDTLTHDTVNKLFIFTDEDGQVFKFHDFDASLPANERGAFQSFTDAGGHVIQVTSWTADGQAGEVQRTTPIGSSTETESLLYSYVSSGVNVGLLSGVILRRQLNAGSWTTVRQVAYTYHDGTDSYGNAGDLKTAVVKDGAGATLETKYYRYYVANETGGYQHALKYVFEGPSYDRLAANVASPFTATDAAVAPYADNHFVYDAGRSVTSEDVQGASCACNGGLGTYSFAYGFSTFSDDYNHWKVKTVETLPDGSENIVFTNYAGQVLLSVYHDTTTGQKWATYYRYDSAGRLVLEAEPSAVSGYSEAAADLLNNQSGDYQYLNNSTGLITTYIYAGSTTATTTTAGDVAGFLKETDLQRGELGAAVKQSTLQYIARTGGAITVYPVASETVYRNADGTGGETTSYAYTWFTGTTLAQSVTTTLPSVSSSQNGPGTADTSVVFYDSNGRPIWTKDGEGFLTYTNYDVVTGAVIKTITDVDTTQTTTFSGKPSGWTTPSGGGLHLTTNYSDDNLGRTTKITDPLGNVTYIVYLDTNHEVRTYAGWQTATNTPTGPTLVAREDWAKGYTETLTMTAAPAVAGGRPLGTEAVSGVQTLARTYTNAAQQVDHEDAYFNLTGLTYSTSTSLGTLGTNFYRTSYDYDHTGRQDKVVSPTGTITRTVYDGLGRPISTWVGTDDTPTSGYWSPTNTAGTDLVKVSEYEYDGGGVGDGNLTKLTLHPGGGADDRVTQYAYDWRDRLVATKAGVQSTEDTSVNRPVTYTEYDNLDQVVSSEQYDGDGVSITTDSNGDGVPDRPSSGLLRAKATAEYDDQGRAFRTHVYSVDPSSGSVSTNSLTADTWYDRRGLVIKTADPGGLVTKTAYDGAGRVSKTYFSDGGGDTGWSDAKTVTGDAVLSQVEMTYDADGNAILVVTRDRFHDETATGALGNATTAPKARVSYTAAYYDAINRVTDTVDVGTNGGSAYTRPPSAPARSDTVLVTSYAYNSAGWLETTTDPRALVGKMYYDALGRTVKTIENYVDGTPSDQDDKTTEFTYDGSGHVLTVKLDLPGGGQQTTQYVYGVAGGSIASNDLLRAVYHPDKSTGTASSGEQDYFAYNALGERLVAQDRNGTAHYYTYDVVGRPTADAVTTLGSGVDGSVRRLETAYDSAGNAYLFTSYDAASGGNVVNQVQRAFNGLGQLITEYQATSGAVNTSTTPKVQYTYSEMAGGANHSRLTSLVNPDGFTVSYQYASGLDSSISRLTSLANGSTTLESYSYLGLGTVVTRAHPQPDLDLTYVGTGIGDGGDQYTGLDRFGRVVDQRWKKASGFDADRYGYGYDRDGNRVYKESLTTFYPAAAAYSEVYAYDGLNQLTSFQRGTLNAAKTGISGTPARSQSFSPDAAGNFASVTTDGAAQARTHDRQNQLTGVGAGTLAYSANGDLTADEAGRAFAYDAWGRLVSVNGGARYAYDALSRRVQEGATALYYSAAWQVVEERVAGATTARYVWSPVYVDALVLRDRDADGSSANGLEQRVYVLQDANYNVTALALLVGGSGSVVQRYAYDPYGQAAVLTDAWLGAQDIFAWRYLHQGLRYDAADGLYDGRARVYSPTLMRFASNDPLGLAAGDANLYRYEGDGPTGGLDPSGLEERRWYTDISGTIGLVYDWIRGPSANELRAPVRQSPPPPSPQGSPESALLDAAIRNNGGRMIAEGLGTYWGQTYYEAGLDANLAIKAMAMSVGAEFAGALVSRVGGAAVEKFVTFAAKKGWRLAKNAAGKVVGLVNKEGKALTKHEIECVEKEFAHSLQAGKAAKGEYGQVGGHHVHGQAGFRGHASYDPNKGFSISQV